MLDPKMCERGHEQYEVFKSSDKSRGKLVQYDYRRLNGELISCVAKTVDDCRKITLKQLEFKGASSEEIRQYITSTYYEPFDYLDEVPCGQPAAETAFKLGVCKACPRNQICAFMVQEMYHDVVYDCTGKEISRYSIGD